MIALWAMANLAASLFLSLFMLFECRRSRVLGWKMERQGRKKVCRTLFAPWVHQPGYRNGSVEVVFYGGIALAMKEEPKHEKRRDFGEKGSASLA